MKNTKTKRKYKGFSLAESMASLLVVGIIVAITLLSTLNVDSRKEKNNITLTKIFYGGLGNAYQNIILNNTNGKIDLRNLEDFNGDNEVNSEDLRDLFIKYMGGQKSECKTANSSNTKVNEYFEDASCATFSQGIRLGAYLDLDCELIINDVKEVAVVKDYSVKTAKNTCGYVIYGLNNSKQDIIGKNIFIIALGKRAFK